jgi:hypothetical protein
MMTGYQHAQYREYYNGGSKNWDAAATFIAGYYTG